MSPPPHREMPAKVEGRDQPEKAKETMAPFRNLMGRLLVVPMSEVKEQQQLYDERKSAVASLQKPKKPLHPPSRNPENSPACKSEK